MSVLFTNFSDTSGWQMGSLNCSIHVVLRGTQPALAGVTFTDLQGAPSHLCDVRGIRS